MMIVFKTNQPDCFLRSFSTILYTSMKSLHSVFWLPKGILHSRRAGIIVNKGYLISLVQSNFIMKLYICKFTIIYKLYKYCIIYMQRWFSIEWVNKGLLNGLLNTWRLASGDTGGRRIHPKVYGANKSKLKLMFHELWSPSHKLHSYH